VSRHQRLGKTMRSPQRAERRLRNRAMRAWKRDRETHILQWAERDGVPDPEVNADARGMANATARAWFGWSRRPVFTGKRGG
jgi:hypothetical protein